jgi:hypothetical protein
MLRRSIVSSLGHDRPKGRIEKRDDVSRSLSQDRRRKAKTGAKAGQRDRGDRKPAKASARNKTNARRCTTVDLFGDDTFRTA